MWSSTMMHIEMQMRRLRRRPGAITAHSDSTRQDARTHFSYVPQLSNEQQNAIHVTNLSHAGMPDSHCKMGHLTCGAELLQLASGAPPYR